MNNLGDILRETRQQQQLSQSEISEDICSQSTLSEIEHNKYIPNTQLLINLCERLAVDFDDLCLVGSFQICREKYFNQKAASFYHKRNYQQLQAFLNRPTVLEMVQNDQQTQAYYFYLALCSLHLDRGFDKAKEYLKLSLACSTNGRKQSTLTRLGNITLAYVYAQQGLKTSTFDQIKLAFRHLEKSNYDENLNLLFYIAALSYFHISKFDLAIQTLEEGIKFALSNNSHSMMINSLYLMANIAEMVKEENVGLTIKSYNIFNSFIRQPLYEEAT
jgi:transcriptional regulator with XRE-family HTH domain